MRRRIWLQACDEMTCARGSVMRPCHSRAGGIDGQSLEDFEANLEQNLKRLQEELQTDTYQPQPVRQKMIPQSGQPGKSRSLGIPTIYDRVCRQALLNRLEPVFEPVFDDANFGYRKAPWFHRG
jgi:RNA-directed DNA polymerase